MLMPKLVFLADLETHLNGGVLEFQIVHDGDPVVGDIGAEDVQGTVGQVDLFDAFCAGLAVGRPAAANLLFRVVRLGTLEPVLQNQRPGNRRRGGLFSETWDTNQNGKQYAVSHSEENLSSSERGWIGRKIMVTRRFLWDRTAWMQNNSSCT